MLSQISRIIALAVAALLPLASSAARFCDHGPAPKLVETDVHFLLGGTAITQNYKGCFPEIRQLNASMGTGWGLGFSTEMGIRDFLALGTQLNLLHYNNRLDIAVSNINSTTMSNVFIKNNYYYLNIPVYASFRFNLGSFIRWNVDAGAYYSYGLSGTQKQTAYTLAINDLGQLIPITVPSKTDFFHSSATFVNRFMKGDIGLYLATGLTFAGHYRIGLQSMIGFKNISSVGTNGIVNPNIHNTSLMMTLGYRF